MYDVSCPLNTLLSILSFYLPYKAVCCMVGKGKTVLEAQNTKSIMETPFMLWLTNAHLPVRACRKQGGP